MQGEEPTTSLVNALVDKVGGESTILVDGITVFEGIVLLCVWHSTRIKPNVDEVSLTLHGLACRRNQRDIVDIGTMHVNAIVVLLTHIARYEAFLLEGIRWHYTSCDSFLNLVI